MSLFDALRHKLRSRVRRRGFVRDLDAELAFHLELEAEAAVRAGLAPDQARLAAQRRLGNLTSVREETRRMGGLELVDVIVQDARYAARRLAHRPAFAAAVAGVLALGIGATTAMFSAVDAAMLRPLPFARPNELLTLPYVQIPFQRRGNRFPPPSQHHLDITDVAGMRDVFSRTAAYASGGLNLSDPDHPLRVRVGVVTADFFATLGVRPARGRVFAAAEGVPNGPPVAILSHQLWQRQFGGRDMLGKSVNLHGTTHVVIGIMPPGFAFPRESDLWIPMSVPTTFATFVPFRGFLPSTVVVRLAPGVTATAASQRVLTRWAQEVKTAPGAANRSDYDQLVDEIRAMGAARPLQETLVGDRRPALFVLLGATGLLLLIACANVTNLLLSQAAMRRREIAVRAMLGASRARIVRQLLVESVMLAMIGTAVGIALAPIALAVMRALMPAGLAGVAPAQIDVRVLGFAVLLSLATGIAFGLWPALGTTRGAANDAMRSGGSHGATPSGSGRARRMLVATEIALTLMLLVGAGLMLRSFRQLMGLDSGMAVARVGTLEMSLPSTGSRLPALQQIEAVVARLAADPAIEAAGVVNDLPLRGEPGMSLSIRIDGAARARDAKGEMTFARFFKASSGYFAAMGIPLLRGRHFAASDDSVAPSVAIINLAMAKKYWPTIDPVGRVFYFAGDTAPTTVIGLVGDVREVNLADEPQPQMYFPVRNMTPDNLAIVARSSLSPALLLARMTDAVRAVDPAQAVYRVRMLDDVVRASVAPRRTNTVLITAFAGLALALSALGIYAVVAYGVAQRSRELGIRSALGASGRDLVRLLVGEMVPVTLIGIALGLGGAWALSRVLTSLVYGVDVHDVTTFVVVPIVLAVPALIAALVPARRALRVNPVDVIRSD